MKTERIKTWLCIVFVVAIYIMICAFFASVLVTAVRGEGNASINYGTKTHEVKKPPTVSGVTCDFDFTGINVCGLGGTGIGTVTEFAAGDLSPLFTTAVLTPTVTPTLLFNPSNTGGHTYYGNNGSGIGLPGFHVIDYSEIANTPTVADQTHSVTMVVDGAGGVLTSGTKNPVKIPYGGTLQGWLLIAKPVGAVTVDIFRAADGSDPVTSIVGPGTKPAVSATIDNSSTSFTSWTSTTLSAKDNLAISLSGISTVTYCQLTLYYQ